jgi:hypothetical protein
LDAPRVCGDQKLSRSIGPELLYRANSGSYVESAMYETKSGGAGALKAAKNGHDIGQIIERPLSVLIDAITRAM